MQKLIRLLPGLALGVVAGAASPALAVPITYTEQATGSGSLNNVTFTNVTVLLTMHNDTNNVTGTPGVEFDNIGTVTVSIDDGPPAIFTPSPEVFSSQSGNTGGFGVLLANENAAFSTYDLMSSIGPLSGTAVYNNGQPFATDDGYFELDIVAGGTATFTATTATTAPEPGSLTLLGVALAGLGLIRRRKKSDAAPQPPSGLAA